MMALRTWLVVLVIASAARASVRGDEIALFVWHDSPNDLEAIIGLERGLAVLGLAASVVTYDVDRDEKKAVELLRRLDGGDARVVVALGTRATLLAKEHVKNVPVIFTAVTNPVLSGISAAWQGSGTNVAGNSSWLDRGEMLEAFRLAVPELGTLAVLRTKDNAVSRAEVTEARKALLGQPGLVLEDIVLDDLENLDAALERALAKAKAIWVPIDYQLYQERPLKRIIERATKVGVPVVSSTPKCVGAGALVVVTVDYRALGLKAASIVKRVVLDGVAPGEIAVGRMSSARIFVDFAAARRADRKLPKDLIFRAHRLLGFESR